LNTLGLPPATRTVVAAVMLRRLNDVRAGRNSTGRREKMEMEELPEKLGC
jgi:hypothetical protein